MPVNPELQGREFPPTRPYLVGREKVREFARAVFATSPLSFDVEAARAAGHPDLVAPPTFPVVVQEATLAQLLSAPDAGIDFSRVVHGDQRFTFSRPVFAGDELTAILKDRVLPPYLGSAKTEADKARFEQTMSRLRQLTLEAVVSGFQRAANQVISRSLSR